MARRRRFSRKCELFHTLRLPAGLMVNLGAGGHRATPKRRVNPQKRPGSKRIAGSGDGEEQMEGKELSELIGLIYDAAMDPDAWPLMLNRLADLLSAQCSVIGLLNSSTNAAVMTAPRTDPEYLRSFTEYWAGHAFMWKVGAKLPLGTVVVREMIIPRDEFCRTDYYNEWCKPQGVETAIAANLLVDGPVSTVIAAYRPYAKGDFDATETRLFAEIIPHLQRALQLQLRLAGLDGLPEGSAEILNRLSQGIILVDT